MERYSERYTLVISSANKWLDRCAWLMAAEGLALLFVVVVVVVVHFTP